VIPGELPNECCSTTTYNNLYVEPGVLNALGDKLNERCRVSTSHEAMREGAVWLSEFEFEEF
jgi:hypothetical protein